MAPPSEAAPAPAPPKPDLKEFGLLRDIAGAAPRLAAPPAILTRRRPRPAPAPGPSSGTAADFPLLADVTAQLHGERAPAGPRPSPVRTP